MSWRYHEVPRRGFGARLTGAGMKSTRAVAADDVVNGVF